MQIPYHIDPLVPDHTAPPLKEKQLWHSGILTPLKGIAALTFVSLRPGTYCMHVSMPLPCGQKKAWKKKPGIMSSSTCNRRRG